MKIKIVERSITCALVLVVVGFVTYGICSMKSSSKESGIESVFKSINKEDYMNEYYESVYINDYIVTLEHGYYHTKTGIMAAIFSVESKDSVENDIQHIWDDFTQKYYFTLDPEGEEYNFDENEFYVSYDEDSINVFILLGGLVNNNKNIVYIADRENSNSIQTEFSLKNSGNSVFIKGTDCYMHITPFGIRVKGIDCESVNILDAYMFDGSWIETEEISSNGYDEMYMQPERMIPLEEMDYVQLNGEDY